MGSLERRRAHILLSFEEAKERKKRAAGHSFSRLCLSVGFHSFTAAAAASQRAKPCRKSKRSSCSAEKMKSRVKSSRSSLDPGLQSSQYNQSVMAIVVLYSESSCAPASINHWLIAAFLTVRSPPACPNQNVVIYYSRDSQYK